MVKLNFSDGKRCDDSVSNCVECNVAFDKKAGQRIPKLEWHRRFGHLGAPGLDIRPGVCEECNIELGEQPTPPDEPRPISELGPCVADQTQRSERFHADDMKFIDKFGKLVHCRQDIEPAFKGEKSPWALVMSNKGVVPLFSQPCAPQANGKIERVMDTVKNNMRARLAFVDRRLWDWCMFVAWTYNRVVGRDGETPFYKEFGRDFSFKCMKRFACLAYAGIQKGGRGGALGPCYVRGAFLGHSANSWYLIVSTAPDLLLPFSPDSGKQTWVGKRIVRKEGWKNETVLWARTDPSGPVEVSEPLPLSGSAATERSVLG
eukprot:gene181-biopygen333